MKKVSPDTAGTIAVLTVDAACYAYRLSNGEITSQKYADMMAEETFVAIASQASGAALQALLPMILFAYLARSMAGGMLSSYGYSEGKELAMEVQDAGGIGVVVPTKANETVNVGRKIIAQMDPKDHLSDLTQITRRSVIDHWI